MTKSDGGEYQCDCTVTKSDGTMCACTDWFIIPRGTRVPSEPRCHSCCMGRHK